MDATLFQENLAFLDIPARRIFRDHDTRIAKVEGESGGDESSIKIINLGTDWSAGEEVHVYHASPERKAAIKLGTAAAPDEAFGSVFKVSRVLKISESAFAGDGGDGLAAIVGATHAVAGSQAQALGVVGIGITDGTYIGSSSHADGIGGYFVGTSTSVSTRSGQGIFALGRRQSAEGVAVGNETAVENATSTPDTYNPLGASLTRGIWLHPIGESDSACGIQVGHTTSTAHFEVGIGINKEAVIGAGYRDDSESLRSIQIKGSHAKAAISVAAGAGCIVVGEEEPANASSLLEILGGGENHDPIFVARVTGSFNIRSQLAVNGSGNVSAFASGGSNVFMTGTALGDGGFSFAAGKTFHVGAAGKTSLFRVTETGVAVNGATPVAKASAITSPAAELPALKTAVDFIREAIKNFGITA